MGLIFPDVTVTALQGGAARRVVGVTPGAVTDEEPR